MFVPSALGLAGAGLKNEGATLEEKFSQLKFENVAQEAAGAISSYAQGKFATQTPDKRVTEMFQRLKDFSSKESQLARTAGPTGAGAAALAAAAAVKSATAAHGSGHPSGEAANATAGASRSAEGKVDAPEGNISAMRVNDALKANSAQEPSRGVTPDLGVEPLTAVANSLS